MSYPCKETFEYPSYKCYKNIKEQFVDKWKNNEKIAQEVLDFETNYNAVKKQKLKDISYVYTNLKKYLSNHHVFAYGNYDGKGTCKYISYLLCDKIHEKSYGECDKDTFAILKEFVEEYNRITGSNMCKDSLKHLDVPEYKKMKALYQVYDKYTSLSSPYLQWIEYNCNEMAHLVYLYNEFLKNYKSDSSKFNTILKDFQNLMNNIVLIARTPCLEKNLAIRNPDLFEEPKVIVPPPTPERENKQSQGATSDDTGRSKPSEVTRLQGSAVGEEVREISQNAKGPVVSYPLTTTGILVSHEAGEREHLHKTLELSQQNTPLGTIESYVPQGSHRPGRTYGSSEYLHTNSTLSPGDENFESTHLKESVLRNEESDYFGKVQGFFTETFRHVEPAPILGVSGGMGALFLLFKYTPVGTFLGGRRGRHHRIPSGFPGAYPGFPEYYDDNGNLF